MIPTEEYKKIAESVPILCVDAIVVYGGKYLLLKRTNEPLKDEWWVPGGRVLKGETLGDAVIRKVRSETGLDVVVVWDVGFYQEEFVDNELEIESIHTVSAVFIVSPLHTHIKLDSTSSAFKWASKLPERFMEQL
jgi:colanic acid biosynthesis protein WcaH